eukprot:COSAG01_NODE_843_length_13172_cov_84.009791_2_plen_52_part_00
MARPAANHASDPPSGSTGPVTDVPSVLSSCTVSASGRGSTGCVCSCASNSA